MTENEFDLQILRLQEVYGKNKYPEERKNVFWKKFHKMGNEAFSYAVTEFIANNERAPMAKDFEAVLRSEFNKIVERDLAQISPCSNCSGGWAWRKKYCDFSQEWREVSLRCYCQWGDQLSKEIPQLPKPSKVPSQGYLFGKETA